MDTIYNKQLKYEKALEYEIFVKGEYNFAEKEIKNAKCIFDVWWHKWFFSKWCRTINSSTKIHYFEPVKEFYCWAQQALRDDKNVILNNYWINSESWKWTILLNQEKTMQSSKYLSFLNPKWREVGVEFITLREYIQQKYIDKIDVLKMDIEWMEFEVLLSRWDFERKRIGNLVIEIHLLNKKMEAEWRQIFVKIENIFWSLRIINSWYNEKIFLLRAKNE